MGIFNTYLASPTVPARDGSSLAGSGLRWAIAHLLSLRVLLRVHLLWWWQRRQCAILIRMTWLQRRHHRALCRRMRQRRANLLRNVIVSYVGRDVVNRKCGINCSPHGWGADGRSVCGSGTSRKWWRGVSGGCSLQKEKGGRVWRFSFGNRLALRCCKKLF